MGDRVDIRYVGVSSRAGELGGGGPSMKADNYLSWSSLNRCFWLALADPNPSILTTLSQQGKLGSGFFLDY